MKRNEMQIFTNALRECLGLGPLYGVSQKTSYQTEETVDPFYGLRQEWRRDMLEMSGGSERQMTREEFRAIGATRSLSKIKTRGRAT